MFRNVFKTFQYVQRYPLRHSLREASFRQNKFMEIGNSTWPFSSKNDIRFKNAARFGVHKKHPSGATFIIRFCVRCLLSLKLQIVLILQPKVIYSTFVICSSILKTQITISKRRNLIDQDRVGGERKQEIYSSSMTPNTKLCQFKWILQLLRNYFSIKILTILKLVD